MAGVPACRAANPIGPRHHTAWCGSRWWRFISMFHPRFSQGAVTARGGAGCRACPAPTHSPLACDPLLKAGGRPLAITQRGCSRQAELRPRVVAAQGESSLSRASGAGSGLTTVWVALRLHDVFNGVDALASARARQTAAALPGAIVAPVRHDHLGLVCGR